MITDKMIEAAAHTIFNNMPTALTPNSKEVALDLAVKLARDALEAAEKARWQPIEEAPKDGTEIWGLVSGKPTLVRWSKASHVPLYVWVDIVETVADGYDVYECTPTHFQPLPTMEREDHSQDSS